MSIRGEYDAEWKSIRTEPPLMDSYSARHLPFGRLTRFGMRKKLEELAKKKEAADALRLRDEAQTFQRGESTDGRPSGG